MSVILWRLVNSSRIWRCCWVPCSSLFFIFVCFVWLVVIVTAFMCCLCARWHCHFPYWYSVFIPLKMDPRLHMQYFYAVKSFLFLYGGLYCHDCKISKLGSSGCGNFVSWSATHVGFVILPAGLKVCCWPYIPFIVDVTYYSVDGVGVGTGDVLFDGPVSSVPWRNKRSKTRSCSFPR